MDRAAVRFGQLVPVRVIVSLKFSGCAGAGLSMVFRLCHIKRLLKHPLVPTTLAGALPTYAVIIHLVEEKEACFLALRNFRFLS